MADILNDDDDDDDDDGVGDYIGETSMDSVGEKKLQRNVSAAIRCASPIRSIARWLAALRKDKERRVVKVRQKIRNELSQSESIPSCTSRSVNGQNDREVSGEKPCVLAYFDCP